MDNEPRDPDDYLFIDEWDEFVDVGWQVDGRKILNHVIRLFNDWQKDHDFDPNMIRSLTANILYAQSVLDRDGGNEWLQTLQKMIVHVRRMS